MAKYSTYVHATVIEFIQNMQSELGELGQEKVFAMMDAFDPDLRSEIIMEMFTNDDSLKVYARISRDYSVQQRQVITAIKWIRQSTGYGLREAKDVTDDLDSGSTGFVKILVHNAATKRNLARELTGTGYRVE